MGKSYIHIFRKICFICVFAIALFGSKGNCDVVRASEQESSVRNLSEEEQRYVEQKKTIQVVVLDGWRPFSAKNEKWGDYEGLAVDLLERLEQETGLAVTYLTAPTYAQAMEWLESGKADLAAVTVDYPNVKQKYNIHLTDPYLSSNMVLLYSKNGGIRHNEKQDTAEVAGYPEVFSDDRIDHIKFRTMQECVAALLAQQVDLMYSDMFTASVYMQEYQNRELQQIPISVEVQFCMGVAPDEPQVLTDLLNRQFAALDREELNESLLNHRLQTAFHIQDFVYQYPFEIICSITALAVFVVVCIATYFKIKSRERAAASGYITSYSLLADTFGEAGWYYDYMLDKMTLIGKYADKLAMPMEIENFNAYLEKKDKKVSLTRAQLMQMLQDGMDGKSFEAEFECQLKDGEWRHFRLIFSVNATEQTYRRPIFMIGCLTDIEDEYREKEHLLHMGMYDKLTGLLNRAGIEEKLAAWEKDGKRKESDILMVMDVDSFKIFNDNYGHSCGDDVLMKLGEQLRQLFWKETLICRWGGDEFFLYVPDGTHHSKLLIQVCESLQSAMKAYEYEGKKIPVRLSIGGASLGTHSVDEAFQAADEALYYVKNHGKNSTHIVTEW